MPQSRLSQPLSLASEVIATNIYDIAKQAGVSIATVSRVLNGSKNVSPKTERRVLTVMEESGYTPNVFARGLGLNTMRTIGILCTDVSDLYYSKAVSILEKLLRELGYDSLLCCTGDSPEQKKKSLEMLANKRVDAMLMIGSGFRENLKNEQLESIAKQVPIVIINGDIRLKNTYSVLCDELGAMKQCVHLLSRAGYRNILYLYDVTTYSSIQKLLGYREGLAECGIPLQEGLIVRTERNLLHIRRQVSALLDQKLPFSAVLAAEDLLAVGAQQALSGRGLRMPVVGFDNSLLAECATPPLTSVDNMVDSLCGTAVRMLGELFAGAQAAERVTISARLVERESFRFSSAAQPEPSNES